MEPIITCSSIAHRLVERKQACQAFLRKLIKSDAFWEQQFREQRERHAREIFARVASAGCINTDESTVDGMRYGALQPELVERKQTERR